MLVYEAPKPSCRRPATMDRNARSVLHQRQRGIGRRARSTEAVEFFNVLTSPELLDTTEALLPEHDVVVIDEVHERTVNTDLLIGIAIGIGALLTVGRGEVYERIAQTGAPDAAFPLSILAFALGFAFGIPSLLLLVQNSLRELVYYGIGILINVSLHKECRVAILSRPFIDQLTNVVRDCNIEDMELAKSAIKALLNLTAETTYWAEN